MNRSLVVLAVLGGLAAGLAVAWRNHSVSVEVVRPQVVAEAPEQSEVPLHLQRASGKKQNPIGTLEVEVRAGGSSAPGIEVVVFRFERIEGAPTGQWLPPSRALTNGDGVARFEVPSVRHLVVAKLPKPLTRQIDVAGGSTPDRVVLEAGVELRLTGTTFDAESKQPLGQVDVTWRPELLAIAPDIASIRTQSDSLGRFVLETPQGVTGFSKRKRPGIRRQARQPIQRRPRSPSSFHSSQPASRKVSWSTRTVHPWPERRFARSLLMAPQCSHRPMARSCCRYRRAA